MVFTRILLPAALVLAGCTTDIDPLPQGPGFGDLDAARAARDAELSGETISLEPVISDETSGEPVITLNNPDISDEQDFEAVSERETIESDAERMARLREAYMVIQPTDLPERQGDRPNIVAFALTTSNSVGEALYRRSGINAERRFARSCARYASADLAQEAFLSMGGPERDRRGMDPDGDGFACAWDPMPFRQAQSGNRTGR